MAKMLVLGAGKSSGVLIKYLTEYALPQGHQLLVADERKENLLLRAENAEHFVGNLAHPEVIQSLVQRFDLVVSLLPPAMHVTVAQACILYGKHLLTASYVSPEIKAMDQEAKKKELFFLMECGLDPGLDHMSAMQLIDRLKDDGAKITSFKSYCGGLVAPESDDNPWGYKVSWNPRNVVLAGKGTAQFLENGHTKFVPYHQLFKRTEPLVFDGFGEYEAYPNRDSISYIQLYGLQDVETFLRGTIRKKGFCEAWDALVQLGLTDESVLLTGASKLTVSDMVKFFLPDDLGYAQYLKLVNGGGIHRKLQWLGLDADEKGIVQKESASPADFLQAIIEKKWALKQGDKDLVLMQHEIKYVLDTEKRTTFSVLAVKGQNENSTAMSQTVGLPLAIATLNVANKQLKMSGVYTPLAKEIYQPILNGLKNAGITFGETTYS
jgi:saccharopine dehydrogenase-like NADP-dependent oxidoreductase